MLYSDIDEDFRWIHTIDDPPLTMSFDFHPLSRLCAIVRALHALPFSAFPRPGVLLHKGIVVGVEQHVSTRHSDGIMFKSAAKTYLFIHHIIQHLLVRKYTRWYILIR